ncbi:unnamed protein product [Rotaria socialis]|uniref:Uncharacterized protein n=1 Tax=Rotaria socialis TaxID=392032 RepID=A0A817ZQ34_9BILA|nr:unnamed protein product [Rotaria socialis]CAF4268567.1 unnamed protein product [Rotaria socialis]
MMGEFILPLRIVAEPKSSHRERYLCEMDPSRNKSQRFIRADFNPENLDYPTIEIPKQWASDKLYIRVTLITVWSQEVPVICIHPYPIDTPESNVIKDPERNTLYFPISQEELSRGRKSFKISLRKLTQQELRNCTSLCLLNKDEKDIQRLSDPRDARKFIEVYQLGKSKLIFSMADRFQASVLPVIYDTTSVYSQIMTASTVSSTNEDDSVIRYVPQTGQWQGGDEILMVIPKLDKRKTCKVYFENSSSNEKEQVNVEFVDLKTIAFTTPPCPLKMTDNGKIEIPITITQSGEEIARVSFCYESCDKCLNCNTAPLFDAFADSNMDGQSSMSTTCFDEGDDLFQSHDHNAQRESDSS